MNTCLNCYLHFPSMHTLHAHIDKAHGNVCSVCNEFRGSEDERLTALLIRKSLMI